VIEFPPYRLDLRAGRLWRGDQPVALRPKAWAFLCYLAERPGILVTKDELHAAVWGDIVVSDDTLTRTLAELRQMLGDDAQTPRIIETVHRRGFRFVAQLPKPRPEEAESVSSSAPWEPAPSSQLAPLVGRDQDLARLRGLFARASAGRRQVVFLGGEPGIGKSVLVEAFLHELRSANDSALIGYGQCVEHSGPQEPYMPVLEALERLSQGPHGALVVSALRSVAPSWLAQIPSLLRPNDLELIRQGGADITPLRMLREFAGLVETIASEKPLVVVLEDLHWSDQGTVDLLSVLAQRPEPARVMLIGTYRPAQVVALDHPIQQVRTLLKARSRCEDIVLPYLRPRDVFAYLERRFPGSRVADDVADIVHAHTDGNPLFMIVLVDHLVARGWLAKGETAWRLTATPSMIEQEVPDNLRQLIEGQLRFFSQEERDVLEVASVAGTGFDAPAVAAGLGAAAETVELICHRLCGTSHWLRYQGNREWPDGALAARYAFRHALYQRTLHDHLSPSRRATLHDRIGRRLEAGFAGRTAEVASDLAKHFEWSRDQRRALFYMEEAATRAYDRRAYRGVIECLEPALRLLDKLPDATERARDELRLRRLYAIVLSQTMGYASDTVLENLTRTLPLCERLTDVPAQFDALCALLLLHANGGDFVRAEAVGNQLAPISERVDVSAVLQCHFLRGSAALWQGNLEAAKHLLAQALASPATLEEADRPYGVNPVVAARSFEGLRRWIIDDAAGARSIQAEAMELAERYGRPFTIAQAATLAARVLLLEEDWSAARKLATRALDLSDEYGFPRWRGNALVIHGRAVVEEGDGDRGLAEMLEGFEVLRLSGLRLGNSLQLAFLAETYLRLNRVDEGLATLEAGLTYCRDSGECVFEAELWRLRGELLVRRAPGRGRARMGVPTEASECFEKARAVARSQGAHGLEQRANRRSS
jgi:DNA-binding winged helix-turn-helix (wHTH) protein/tetratricopeptide (TPR) repeat protein